MIFQTVFSCPVRYSFDLIQRIGFTAPDVGCVFQTKKPCGGKKLPVRSKRIDKVIQIKHPLISCDCANRHSGKSGRGPDFITGDMPLLFDQQFLSCPAVSPNRGLVRLRAGTAKHRSRFSQQITTKFFQSVYCWIFRNGIIPHFGFAHGLPHGGCWFSEGIAAKIYLLDGHASTQKNYSGSRAEFETRIVYIADDCN